MEAASTRTLADLTDAFASHGDAPAILAFSDKDEPNTVSYGELHGHAERLARGLRDVGVGSGDMVLLCAPNSVGWIAAYFGIVRAGATAVPLDDQAGESMLAAVLRHSRPRYAFTSQAHAQTLNASEGAPPEYALLDAAADNPSSWLRVGDGSSAALEAVGADAVASLLYTSGTTGTPKAVPLTHANLVGDANALIDAELITTQDRVLMPLPLHHTYPFTVGMLTVLGTGATIVMPSGVTGPAITGAAKSSDATAMIGVPSLYEAVWQSIEARVKAAGRSRQRLFRGLLALSRNVRRLTGRPIGRLLFRSVHGAVGPKLEILGCGGAKLEPSLAANLEALGWTVLTGYGLTETSPVLTFNSRRQRRLTSEGRPVPGVEIRIDKQPDEAHGEILARGPNVFSGYWQNAEATQSAFKEGWFRTGDLGFVDDDGYLHVVGRLKEVIVLADGKNVFPEDVEPAYASPLLSEMAILERNGALVALVVPDEDEVRRRGGLGVVRLLKEELERLALQLPRYQRIVDFRVVREPLPRTRLGKLKRHQLPELYDSAGKQSAEEQPAKLSDADRALIDATPTTSAVWSWLEERYPDRHLRPDMSPQFDLQIDSLGWVSMTLELEQRFGVSIPAAAVSRVMTLRDLLEEVRRAEAEGPPTAKATDASAPEPQGRALRAAGAGLYALNRGLVRTLFRLNVVGIERLPQDRCVAIAPNHLSYLDPLAISAALPPPVLRDTYWAGWVGVMFTGPFSRSISRATRVFPVDPDQDLAGALGTARKLLERNASVVWFPEGRRSPTGTLQPFRPGIGVLLKDGDCLAVPTCISGTYEAWPLHRRLPRLGAEVTVAFGEPVSARVLADEGEGDTEELRIAHALERRVAALAEAPDGGGLPPQREPAGSEPAQPPRQQAEAGRD